MPSFGVFLSHNSNDKPTVRALKQALAERGLKCWLDEEQLRPGLSLQNMLEQGIKDSGSVAVCVAADGLGPWEDQEMQAALWRAVKDSRPVIPVLLPGVSSVPELPLFLGNHVWVDLREGLGGEGIAKLILGITGKLPGEGTTAPPDVSGGGEVPISSDTRFLDEIFELLHTHPTLILLAQEDREQHAGLKALRKRAQRRFGMDRVLHLVPPLNADVSEAEFFRILGRRAGMDPPRNAIEFGGYLDKRLKRLTGEEQIFLLVTGLSECSGTERERLADSLHGLNLHHDILCVVLVGGEGLVDLKFVQNVVSLLSYAEPMDWPEFNTGDLMEFRPTDPPTWI